VSCLYNLEVKQTVFLIVERHRERPIVGADASRAVEADAPFGPPLVLARVDWRVVHTLPHHPFYHPL
jgi:hypothetical protein